MLSLRSARWLSAATVAAFCAAALCVSPAWASGEWGEIARFEGSGTGAEKGHKFVLSGRTHAFGIDAAESNSIYVGDELASTEGNESFRIQKYTENGAFQAEAKIAPPAVEPFPTGTETLQGIEGVAVDHELGRIYILVVFLRNTGAKIDPGVAVAGRLYAFKTKPEGNKLVSATTNKEGLLTPSSELNPGSETPGQALLNPSGIAVDPKTHEVLLLGSIDQGIGSPGERIAIDRIASAGKVEPRYVDPTPIIEEEETTIGHSPVVSKAGKVYFEKTNRILTTDLVSTPTPVFSFAENLLKGAFQEELAQFDEPSTESGGGLALEQEGETTGRFVSAGEIHRMNETGKPIETVNSVLGVSFAEEGTSVKTSEIGWTAGPGSEEPKPCAIEFGNNYPLTAAGSGNATFVLTSRATSTIETGEVVKFGQGGSGCLKARALGEIEAKVGGIKVKEPDTVHPVTLSVNVEDANVLSTEWSFGDGGNETVSTAPGQQTQVAEALHKFASGGELTVHATIHTDDLTTPEIKVATTFHVQGGGGKPPEVTQQPVNQSVFEGEAATFEARASGEPFPTVQWELSSDHGTTWTNVPGATAEKLIVAGIKASQSGNEYRAAFKNAGGEAKSSAATLTVKAAKAPVVTKQPSSQTVPEGQTATFEATASGEPAPTAQWELSTDHGATWSAVAGASTENLIVASTKLSQSGDEYRATFKSSVGEAKSNPATLTVTKTAPEVTKQPTNQTVVEGETAVFEATASGEPTVQWELSSDHGTTWSVVAGASTEKLIVAGTELSQSGREYRATFKNSVGKAISNPATLTVITAKAVVVTKQPGNQTVAEGETATFEATAAGAPAPTVQWELSTDHGTTWIVVAGAISEKLGVAGATAAQSGDEYRASFKNSIAEATSNPATLTVTAKAPQVTQQPGNQTVFESETALFEAKASGEPTVQWELSTDHGTTWSVVAGASSEKVIVTGTKVSQSGDEYRASFKNGVGSATSSAATLRVKEVKARASGTAGGGGSIGEENPSPGGGNNTGGGVLGQQQKNVPPRASVAGTSLSVSRSGAVAIKVSCPPGATTCIGIVTLRTLTAVSERADGAKAKRKILTLAAGSFSVAGGTVRTITLHLSPQAKGLLARSHVLRARSTVVAHDPSGQSATAAGVVTLHAAKPHRHH